MLGKCIPCHIMPGFEVREMGVVETDIRYPLSDTVCRLVFSYMIMRDGEEVGSFIVEEHSAGVFFVHADFVVTNPFHYVQAIRVIRKWLLVDKIYATVHRGTPETKYLLRHKEFRVLGDENTYIMEVV